MKRDAIELSTVIVFTLFRKYFIPTLFGMLSMAAVTAIDGIFVGQGVGSDGIAAVNISIIVGGLIAIIYLLFYAINLRLYPIKISFKSLRLFVRNISCQCHIGSSALLAEATLATLMFIGNQIFMKYLGENGVGAFGIACYYIPFVFMVGNAIAQSAQPIISYNFGLGYQKRVLTTEKIALMTSFICGIIIMSLFIFCPQILV